MFVSRSAKPDDCKRLCEVNALAEVQNESPQKQKGDCKVFCKWLITAFIVLFTVIMRGLLFDVHSHDKGKVISCYYNTPDYSVSHQLLPSDIRANLCTHINVAFAKVKDNKIYLDTSQQQTLTDLVKLKLKNPNLKILLSVAGGKGDRGFPDMVVNHASRKVFIKSIKAVLRNFSLDGIDLDWEFPAVNNYRGTYHKRERQHFSQLLREIKAEYIRERRNYLLTVAVAAPESIVSVAYDISILNQYVDFINLMTYDFHFFSNVTPLTGLNSPLYQQAKGNFLLDTLNVNSTVNMYMRKGLEASKIVVGIPTYGHSFTLVNADNPNIGSPASGYGSLGRNGFVLYPDICKFLNEYSADVTIVQDQEARVPYAYRNKEWVSFDSPQSVVEKATYIKNNNLRGAMIYSLSADDHEGVCGGRLGSGGKFPLAESIKSALGATKYWTNE